jgi:hypothetical protein
MPVLVLLLVLLMIVLAGLCLAVTGWIKIGVALVVGVGIFVAWFIWGARL